MRRTSVRQKQNLLKVLKVYNLTRLESNDA